MKEETNYCGPLIYGALDDAKESKWTQMDSNGSKWTETASW